MIQVRLYNAGREKGRAAHNLVLVGRLLEDPLTQPAYLPNPRLPRKTGQYSS